MAKKLGQRKEVVVDRTTCSGWIEGLELRLATGGEWSKGAKTSDGR